MNRAKFKTMTNDKDGSSSSKEPPGSGRGRSYVSLSFSARPELEDPLNQRAGELGLNRSEYVCKLIERDLMNGGLIDEKHWHENVTKAPPRVTRGRKRPAPSKKGPDSSKKK
jgi:hypothetical protein